MACFARSRDRPPPPHEFTGVGIDRRQPVNAGAERAGLAANMNIAAGSAFGGECRSGKRLVLKERGSGPRLWVGPQVGVEKGSPVFMSNRIARTSPEQT